MKAVLLCFSIILSSGLAQNVQPINCNQSCATNCVGNCQNQVNCTTCHSNCQQTSCTNCQTNCAQQTNCVSCHNNCQQTSCSSCQHNCAQQTNCVNCHSNCQHSSCTNCQNNCVQPTNCANCQNSCIHQPNCVPQPSVPCPVAPIICPTPTPHPTPYITPNPIIDKTVIIINNTDSKNGSRIIERYDADDGSVITLSITNIIHTNNTIHAPVNITNYNVVNTPVYISDSSHVQYNKSDGGRPIKPDPQPEKCCSVITPKVCRTQHNDWSCSHHKYRRCGSFCVAPKIHLRTRWSQYRDSRLIVPPLSPQQNSSPQPYNPYPRHLDCSGCMTHQYHHCSAACYASRCIRSRGCQYQDQHEFCNEFGGDGCSEEDGFYDGQESGNHLPELEYPIH